MNTNKTIKFLAVLLCFMLAACLYSCNPLKIADETTATVSNLQISYDSGKTTVYATWNAPDLAYSRSTIDGYECVLKVNGTEKKSETVTATKWDVNYSGLASSGDKLQVFVKVIVNGKTVPLSEDSNVITL